MHKIGIKNEIIDIGSNRFNVIAEIGSGDGFILSSHMDTVPVGDKRMWKHDQFSGLAVDGKLYGRGSSDTKSGLASILSALSQLDLTKVKRRLLLLFVADEEVASKGSNWLLKNRKELFKGIKYGITTECTDNKIRTAQKGQVVLNIKFNGKAAHGSKPWLGKNAINDAARFLTELGLLAKKLEKKKDPLLGYSTINVGKISGGTKVNIVADRCEISTDNRLITAVEPKWLINEYKKNNT